MSLLKPVGLKEIAYELGVSVNTVSRALRDCDDISLEMKKKVRSKAIEMGYSPNAVEEFVKKDYKKNIAFLGSNFDNLYFTIMCNEFLKYLDSDKYNFTVVVSNGNHLDVEGVKRCILQRVDAIISFIEPLPEAINLTKLYKIPMLLVGRRVENADIDQIYTDDRRGGALAGEYLIERHQCKKLCFLSFKDIECAERRYLGFNSVAKEHSLHVDKIYVSSIDEVNADYFIKQGYDGIFCFNDELAYYLLYNASTSKDEIDTKFKDVHIVGYDALAHRIRGLKRITSINSNYHEIAKESIDLIVRRLESKDSGLSFANVTFPVALYLRLH